MFMYVEQPYTCPEFEGIRKEEFGTSFNPLLEVDPVLAHNVIHHKCNWDIFHVVRQCLANAVVHVDLPVNDEIVKSDGPKRVCIPLSLLEVHHRSWNEESMATGSRTNTCDIKMGPTGVGLFNGSICVACIFLLDN